MAARGTLAEDSENVKRKRMSPIAATSTVDGGLRIAKRNAQSSEKGLGEGAERGIK